jgi:hypothetical protein
MQAYVNMDSYLTQDSKKELFPAAYLAYVPHATIFKFFFILSTE